VPTARLGSVQPEIQQRGRGRPPVSSREAVEKAALSIMMRDGYENVSIDMIVAAAGISRTTLFRYFGSKPGIIWRAFDDTISGLDAELRESGRQETSQETEPVENVRAAIVASTRSAIGSSDMWLQRFELLDTSPALRSGAYDHWERWKQVIAEYLAARSGHCSGDAEPMAVAAAFQAVFLSVLRDRAAVGNDRDKVLNRLDQTLARVSPALGRVLSQEQDRPHE
jgi:AcrR family transcriptional regulator